MFDIIVHKRKTAVAACHHMATVNSHDFRTQLPGFGDSQYAAVISHIRTVLQQVETFQDAIHFIGKAQLFRARFPPGEVKGQFFCLDIVKSE